ncbi:tRNA (adenosine(37)-N6)-dimethylallyltransferase MiaA [Terrimonas rubra]|uniref:tRNA dimethylallyltransferase n=1 Tax=Terrimonas rubra TaxID=1035890 RepID=A0ABW6A8J1_9BACT
MAGPTAVGKTAAAIQVAQQLNAEIISADSRQCFRELDIGVARPAAEELQAVPHHFIASHSIHQAVTAADFEQYALDKTAQLFRKNNYVVMVGGTGLYIKAFIEGLDLIPDIPADLRQAIITQYNQQGLSWLQQQVAAKDPLYYATGEIQNPQRLMRALEVITATGTSITQFQTRKKQTRPFNIIRFGLELPREQLVQRINERVDRMMEQGLLSEVEQLLPYRHLNALQTVGYKELFDYMDGLLSLPEAVERIKINTRQYAKRQMTWFKRDEAIEWLKPDVSLARILQDLGKNII